MSQENKRRQVDYQNRETYVLAAFNVDSANSIMYTKYVTLVGLGRGVRLAMEKGADYISLRRIRAKEEGKCPECSGPATHPSGLCRDCHQSKLEAKDP